MIQIDLSFLKIASQTAHEKQNSQIKANDNFKYKIFDLLTDSIVNNNVCSDCSLNMSSFHTWDERNIIEVNSDGFWGLHFCEIPNSFERQIKVGDYIVETDGTAYDVAQVKQVGKLVNMKRNKLNLYNESLPTVTRIVTKKDVERIAQNEEEEKEAMPYFRELVHKHNLEMKLVNIHYQFDRKKLYFFYTADGRIDFRALAKDLANYFKTRIELRQIGVRDEAQKVGGLGTCGREYCCATFLNEFKRIQTTMLNGQNISSNSSKLTGPCGKLKCCLSYEAVEQN